MGLQCDGARTEDCGRAVAVFVGADVDHAVDNSRKAPLVGRRRIGVVSPINGRTAAEQRVRESGTAVVLERTQLQFLAGNIEVVVRAGSNRDVRATNEVIAAGPDQVGFNAEKIEAG